MPILLTLRSNSNSVAPSLSANARAESTIFLRIDGSTTLGIVSSTVSTNARTACVASRRLASLDSNITSDRSAARLTHVC